jgi:hypothetical protein
MPSFNTSDQSNTNPTHQDFQWIHGPGREEKFADFIELTRDITAGIDSSLQIIYASELAREMNLDAEADDQSAPAIGKTDAANLMRLSMAVIKLLHHNAQEHIDALNTFWED